MVFFQLTFVSWLAILLSNMRGRATHQKSSCPTSSTSRIPVFLISSFRGETFFGSLHSRSYSFHQYTEKLMQIILTLTFVLGISYLYNIMVIITRKLLNFW